MVKFMLQSVCTQCVPCLLSEFYFFCFGSKIGRQFALLISIKKLKLWYGDFGKYFKHLFEEVCFSLLMPTVQL